MLRASILRAFVAALSLTTVVGSADAALLGADFQDGTLYDVNPATGAATNPRETGITGIVDIEAAADGSVLYGLDAFGASPRSALYRINPTTGASTLIGPSGMSIAEGDLALQPGTGNMFAVGEISGKHNLLRLNLSTGQATVVGSIPLGDLADPSALSFGGDNKLYLIDTNTNALLTIDPSTGAVTASVNVSVALGEVAGMTLDRSNGKLYVTGETRRLYTLNTGTGQLTDIGPTGLHTQGLAGLTYVPEPSSTAFIATCALALLRRRSRIRSHLRSTER
jgi:streptogramin lyase